MLATGRFSRAIAADGPVAGTTAGKIRGLIQGKIISFKGVPYGASTAGAGRFMPPVKTQPWTGVRDAIRLGPESPQGTWRLLPEQMSFVPGTETMSEDCLCLNVWTPGMGNTARRPVMVWVHAGGYTNGSGGVTINDGANLARARDVVVVTLNFRLNAFGYLYLADLGGAKYADSSNIGQLDIIAALEWVRDNIAAFGGDAGNVTLWGVSGGGSRVSTLMAMPAAKGLFHKAIVQSSSALKGIPRDRATRSAAALMAALGLKPDQVDELQKVPMDRLVAATESTPGLQFGPVVDGRSLPNDPFDPAAPEMSANVPMLIGSVETEVTFFQSRGISVQDDRSLDPLDDAALHARVKQAMRVDDATADRLIAVYKKGRPNADNRDVELIMVSDAQYNAGVRTEAERKAAQGNAPVYLYYFTWRTPVREGKLRTPHMLEVPFVFENLDAGKDLTGSGPERYALAHNMSAAWAAFARTGNPNRKGLPNWPAFDAGRRATMIFNNESRAVNDPYREERLALNADAPVGRI
jgi:para-nitrobenzyl esterase